MTHSVAIMTNEANGVTINNNYSQNMIAIIDGKAQGTSSMQASEIH